jgi:2-keto-4-pentenoate hydratase
MPCARRAARSRSGARSASPTRTIWPEYGVYAPIWGFVYDSTVHELGPTAVPPLAGLAEPRIEPEVVFGLAAAPSAGMDEAALLSCLEWVAHGFEIVQSIYPQWKFAAADTIAANGVHGALLIGPRHPIAARAGEWQTELSRFDIDLLCDGRISTAAMPPMSSTARSPRSAIWSGCSPTTRSIRRSPPARS